VNKPDPSLQHRESDNICGIEKDVAAGHSKMSCAPLTLYINTTLFMYITETNPLVASTHTKKQFSHEKIMPGFFCCCNKQKKILFEESKCISKHFNVTNKFEFD